jgi:tetratricopeptide (TPR) repeat protein
MENLPPYFTPTRDRRGQVIAALCFGLIVLFLVWTMLANLRQGWMSPQMRSGLSALSSKSTAEARTLFESALRQDPQNPELYQQILNACQDNQDWDLVVLFGERAVQQCRDAPEAVRSALYGQLAAGYSKAKGKGWKTLARETARRALELAPFNPANQNLLGYTLVDTFDRSDKAFNNPKDLDEAERLIVQAMKTVRTASPLKSEDPGLASIEDSYAWLLFKRERYSEAALLLTDIVNRVDTSVFGSEMKELYFHLGATYSRLGRYDDARWALQTALTYDPKFSDAKTELYSLPNTSAPNSQKN